MSFQKTLAFEDLWRPSSERCIRSLYPAHVHLSPTGRRHNGRLQKADAHIQKKAGDLLAYDTLTRETLDYHEIKMEATEKYGNLFIETWSNLTANRDKWSEGWLWSCEADWLWYGFADTRHLYQINLPTLRTWLNQTVPHKTLPFSQSRLSTFKEKSQGKHAQRNLTVGRTVPIKTLLAAGMIAATHIMEPPHDAA